MHCQFTEWQELIQTKKANMSSKWKEWVQEWVSKEVLGVQCGEITRFRSLKLNASHGGKSCEEQFNCTSDCYKDHEDKVCPGMCQ